MKEHDRIAVTCSKCGHRFIEDVDKFVTDSGYPSIPRYMPANCPRCHLATVVNLENPRSSNRPDLQTIKRGRTLTPM